MKILNKKIAFKKGLLNNDLSISKTDYNFINNYMYMYSDDFIHYFKNKITRKYLKTIYNEKEKKT
jgi:hypothetical protein